MSRSRCAKRCKFWPFDAPHQVRFFLAEFKHSSRWPPSESVACLPVRILAQGLRAPQPQCRCKREGGNAPDKQSAHWLIGADSASSNVRGAPDVNFEGFVACISALLKRSGKDVSFWPALLHKLSFANDCGGSGTTRDNLAPSCNSCRCWYLSSVPLN